MTQMSLAEANAPLVLTVAEIAPLWNAASKTFYRHCQSLPGALRVGKQLRFVRRLLLEASDQSHPEPIDRAAIAAELVAGLALLITPQDMAGVLRVGDLTMRRLAQAGDISGAFKVGGKWRCPRVYFAHWLAGTSDLPAAALVAAELVAGLPETPTLTDVSQHLHVDAGLVAHLAEQHELPCAYRVARVWFCPRSLYAAWLARQMSPATPRWN
jgi:hypothetical protein